MSGKPTYEELAQRIRELERVEAEHKRVVSALKKSENKYRSTLNDLLVGVIVHGRDTRILLANPAASDILGLTWAQMSGKMAIDLAWQFVDENSRKMNVEDYPVSQVSSTKRPLYGKVIGIKRPDRDFVTWVIANATPVFTLGGDLENIVVNFAEITDLKHAKEALGKSEAKYRDLYQNAPIGLYRTSFDGRMSSVNATFLQLFGHDFEKDMLAVNVADLYVDPEERSALLGPLAKTGRVADQAILLKKKDGTRFWGLVSAVATKNRNCGTSSYDGFIYDITETKRLQNQLVRTQKMEAIGTLAGGIAHDFNNILGAVLGYAELARMISSENPKVQRYLDQINIASERARGLVQQILAFSRQDESKKMPVDIGVIVKEALKLLRASIPSTIGMRLNVQTNLGAVAADPTQIHRIVMNLCTNAFHAMQGEAGKLDVDLVPIEISATDALTYQEITPGRYLKLTVADTGHGMDEKTLARMFEPYFTTKEVGEGTGLGLSTVHGIVKSHGGDIRVYSEPGTGTSFHLLFPVIEEKTKKAAKPSHRFPGGKEQVLFIDDEKALADVGKKLLESLGYRVETRTDPLEALDAFRKEPAKYDMIITDMTMPKMSGVHLAGEIMKIQPDIPIILCTGFSKALTPENAEAMGIGSVLMKPLTLHDLATAVRQLLDGEKPPSGG